MIKNKKEKEKLEKGKEVKEVKEEKEKDIKRSKNVKNKKEKLVVTSHQCSPARSLNANESCLTSAELKALAAAANLEIGSSFEKDTIEEKVKAIVNRDPRSPVGQLYSNIKAKAYKPPKPKTWSINKRKWLDTNDIMAVMKQYEDAHPHFAFLGVFPIDFAEDGVCRMQSTCDIRVADLQEKGKRMMGMVINLDRHDQSGSHWVAWFCCFDPTHKKYGQCFYDSGGHKPPPIFIKFMKDIKGQMQMSHTTRSFKARYNRVLHQFQNTECGIFSMLFLTTCLESEKHETYQHVKDKIKSIVDTKDDGIFKFRSHFYL
jgi:hypothetical protein